MQSDSADQPSASDEPPTTEVHDLTPHANPRLDLRDHYLPPDAEAFRRAEPTTGRLIVIAPTRAACETIELALRLNLQTLLEREHGDEIRSYAREGVGFGVVAGTGTGKTLAVKTIAEQMLQTDLRVGVVNREREATPKTPTWNVVIVTTGIARRWFQSELIDERDTLVIDEIHQTSSELELCLALGKRVGCRFIWLSATVDPSFYARYLDSAHVLHTYAFDPTLAATVETRVQKPLQFLDNRFMRDVLRAKRGVAVFLPTRAEVEDVAAEVKRRWRKINAAFYHGGEPIRVIRPFLEGEAEKPFLLVMTAAGQSALNIRGLDTVVIYDARYTNVIERGRNVLTRQYLGPNEILQMAGRVHGRVPDGEVFILTDRSLDFSSLVPEPPDFQLAGDTERVALTAAALGVDLTELELPVPLDRTSYRNAIARLSDRGIVEDGRLTSYGHAVEAMPVDRAWGELLVVADDALTPFVAVAANIESLHRMTRDERDLSGLIVTGSDHLTAYNVYAEAVNEFGHVGRVYELPRHLFSEDLREWAEGRGVLVKAIEDIALGTASVYRTLELELPKTLPRADNNVLRRFRDLLAETMPLDFVLDEQTADGEPVRVARGSFCNSWGAVAGTLRYFADRHGVPRGAIEGTNIPLVLVKKYARLGPPEVEYRAGRKHEGLHVTRRTTYFGFQLDRSRQPLEDPFPADLAEAARRALRDAVMAGITDHPQHRSVRKVLDRIGEYWRRSGGTLGAADPGRVRALLDQRLATVSSYEAFRATPLAIDIGDLIPEQIRAELDALPSSTPIHGDRAPLDYEIENGRGVVRLRLREGQARRLRTKDLPNLDRPIRFTVVRGKRGSVQGQSLEDLRNKLRQLPRPDRVRRKKRRRR